MVEAQGGACLICRQPETMTDSRYGTVRDLAVDHCHISGHIRGLLCTRCNTVLGLMEDRPELLRASIEYLTQSQ